MSGVSTSESTESISRQSVESLNEVEEEKEFEEQSDSCSDCDGETTSIQCEDEMIEVTLEVPGRKNSTDSQMTTASTSSLTDTWSSFKASIRDKTKKNSPIIITKVHHTYYSIYRLSIHVFSCRSQLLHSGFVFLH